MKKFLAILTVMMCVSTVSVFAQNDTETKQAFEAIKPEQDSLTRDIVPEKQHTTNKTAKVRLEYTPLTGEVRLYYTCLAVSFDTGEAMNTAIAVLEDFAEEYQYMKKTFMAKDKTKYYKDDNGLRMAEYRSYVRFTR